jgi:uncharacterized protein (TIGR03790 family)
MSRATRYGAVGLVVLTLFFSSRAVALTPDELLLVVNRNEPAGMELARHYAEVRKVPPGRIVEVDVPTWNEMAAEQFERDLATPVREFLRKEALSTRVKCLVTFYGIPLRTTGYPFNEFDASELKAVSARLVEVEREIAVVAQRAEALAKRLGATPDPASTGVPPNPATDAERLLNAAGREAERLKPVADRSVALGEVFDLLEQLGGDAGTVNRLRVLNIPPSTRPAAANTDALTLEIDLREARKQLDDLLGDRDVRNARVSARKLARRFGLIGEAGVLRAQQQWLTPGNTAAAVDSELSLVMVGGYPRDRWIGNPLNHRAGRVPGGPLVYMVSRIDGPTVEATRAMIDTTIAVEERGLGGNVVVDLGMSKNGQNAAYIAFDKSLETYADFVRDKTKFRLTFDQEPTVLPAGAVNDIALYCGWYSLRTYQPPGSFVPGAVGYHVASAELVTLHDPEEKGWCRGMLTDGACGTLGAVSEPYLHAFPQPQEFFPVLMTGRLTLAETYWRTNPLGSWMIALVGDPLYNPFKARPMVKIEDLPSSLRDAVGR